jgi:hypothetical protein
MKRATPKVSVLRLALGLTALLGLSAPEAHAGHITLTLGWAGNSLPIDFNSPFANPGSTADSLAVNTAALNAFRGGSGSVFPFLGGKISFSNLSATSNFPGAPGGATLTVSGTANLTGGDGPASVTVVATQSGFTIPSGPGTLHSTATANFANASTDNPHAKPIRSTEKSLRRIGGQPGHNRQQRPLIPTEQCQQVFPCVPRT